jgi:hypothetical protein
MWSVKCRPNPGFSSTLARSSALRGWSERVTAKLNEDWDTG